MTQTDNSFLSSTLSPAFPFRIITHNIRYAAPPSQRFSHEQPWSDRRLPLTQQLHFLTRQHFTASHSIICLQEVLTEQFNDISSSLGDAWTAYGIGRDDGKEKGERNAIFFLRSAWECLHSETVWLNEIGEVGKKGWDAGSVRVVSCVVLQAQVMVGDGAENASAGRKLLVMNTHLDDQGVVARREGTRILLEILGKLSREWRSVDAYGLAGDLNSEVDGDAYKILDGEDSGLKDALTCLDADGSKVSGDTDTYTGFDGQGDDEEIKRIDFVFVPEKASKDEQEQMVQGYATMSNLVNGSRMSDHQVVVVDMLI